MRFGNRPPQKESQSPFLQETTARRVATIPTVNPARHTALPSAEPLPLPSTSRLAAPILTTPELSRLSGTQPIQAQRHQFQLQQKDTSRKFRGTIRAQRRV